MTGRFSRTDALTAPAQDIRKPIGALPRILCVDDDERLLAGLELRLRRAFDVTTATSAVEALAKLDLRNPFATVVSDMRMPQNDGATFLSAIRRVAPDTTRVLLTGQADVPSAIAAINEGEVFRFLVKPIETPALLATLNEAVSRHTEAMQQRLRLDDLVSGVSEILRLTLSHHADAFADEVAHIRRVISEMTSSSHAGHAWNAEMAANAFHIACMGLSPQLRAKWKQRQEMTQAERSAIRSVVNRCCDTFEPIAIMSGVSEALTTAAPPDVGPWLPRVPANAGITAHILYLALTIDAARLRGESVPEKISQLRRGASGVDLSLLASVKSSAVGRPSCGCLLSEVQIGERIVSEVRLANGLLFLPAAHTVTETTIAKIKSLDLEEQSTYVYALRH